MFAFKLQTGRSKIQKKSEVVIGGGKIIDDLNFIGFCQSGNSLQFTNQRSVYHHVCDEIANDHILVSHRDSLIEFNRQSSPAQLKGERIAINGFQKTGSKLAMTFHRKPYDLF